ncbi:DNA repair protein, putative [Trypanosoma brucei gambiense DAL972]|uniref:DNA repair protein, putative n=1 Tax=Trypanosoma brucei gambiense (strain MHOM/CI/86/DAL972) TaxID=679716 RepID=C9ZSC1_TRYB9|nr:DNA repair protein, putative [Trypanosoma brucei gambiense DAL972]CBH12259.1 DNA repair protein, putative [Trypanosoma brucei gambiense DAL972]|eukprot:XP_011774540.1 DNA repair protein, putative [Trypanosoma brucei gambiense DAL972]
MPPLPRGVVKVVGALRGDNIIRIMQRHRYVIEEADDPTYDFLCGGTCVVFVDDAGDLSDAARRTKVSQQLSVLKTHTGASWRCVVLLLRVVSEEVRPDILAWLNLHCSVEQGCGVMLFWTDEECAAYLEGLSDSNVATADYCVGVRRDSTPMQLLIDALTQTPQLMTRNDVVRAVNSFGSVAGLLTATAEQLTELPGFAQKKAGRLHAVLNAPFNTSRCLVADVLQRDQDESNDESSERRPAQETMKQALRCIYDREDEDVQEGGQ